MVKSTFSISFFIKFVSYIYVVIMHEISFYKFYYCLICVVFRSENKVKILRFQDTKEEQNLNF